MFSPTLLSLLLVAPGKVAETAKDYALPIAVLAAVPGILAALPTLIDRIGRRSRFEETKTSLEILKMKYEIEAIRKREQLDFPPISITPEEIQLPATRTHELRWFQPQRLRATFTFRNVVAHPRYGRILANLAAGVAAFYGVVIVIAAAAYFSPDFRAELEIGGWTAAGLTAVYVIAGTLLFLWGRRIRKATRLALGEIKAVAGTPQ